MEALNWTFGSPGFLEKRITFCNRVLTYSVMIEAISERGQK